MDKKYTKQYVKTGHKNCRLGIPIGIHDKEGNELCTGDKIKYYGEECIILWDVDYEIYVAMICSSMWYGDKVYDYKSYGKSYQLIMDDGARMEIEKL